MNLLAYESMEAAQEAAMELKSFGAAARKLMAECAAEQDLTRTSISKAATMLNNAGFIFITEPEGWEVPPRWKLRPALAGEEALEVLELIEENEAAAKLKKKP